MDYIYINIVHIQKKKNEINVKPKHWIFRKIHKKGLKQVLIK